MIHLQLVVAESYACLLFTSKVLPLTQFFCFFQSLNHHLSSYFCTAASLNESCGE